MHVCVNAHNFQESLCKHTCTFLHMWLEAMSKHGDIFLNHYTFFLRQGFSLNLELIGSVLILPTDSSIPDLLHGCWFANAGPVFTWKALYQLSLLSRSLLGLLGVPETTGSHCPLALCVSCKPRIVLLISGALTTMCAKKELRHLDSLTYFLVTPPWWYP